MSAQTRLGTTYALVDAPFLAGALAFSGARQASCYPNWVAQDDGTRRAAAAFAKRPTITGAAVHPFLAWAFPAAPDLDSRQVEGMATRIFDALADGEALTTIVNRLVDEQRRQRSARGVLVAERVGQLVADWKRRVDARSESVRSSSSGTHKKVP